MKRTPNIKNPFDDEALNITNVAIDKLNVLGQSIQYLVAQGQLTPSQYAGLIKEVNGLISHGHVSVYDIDKNKGLLDQSFLSPELLKQIAGTAPILSTLADGSVTSSKITSKAIEPYHTTFFEGDSDNLFTGEYVAGWIGIGGSGPSYSTRKNGTTFIGNTAVIPIKPNTMYSLATSDDADVLRVAVSEFYPNFESTTHRDQDIVELVSDAQTLRSFSVAGRPNANYLIINTTQKGVYYPLIVVEGDGVPNVNDAQKISNKFLNLELNGFPKFEFKFGTVLADSGEIGNSTRRAVTQPFPVKKGFYIGIQDNSEFNFFTSGWDKNNGEYIGSFSKVSGESFITEDCIARIGLLRQDGGTLYESDFEKASKLIYTTRYNATSEQNEEVSTPVKNARFNMVGDFDRYYEHEIENHWASPDAITPTQYHDKFKTLIDQHDIAYRKLLGQDDFGNNIYEYGIKNTDYYITGTGSSNPGTSGIVLDMAKIIITAGIHGREKSTNYAVYETFKAILENPNDLDTLDSLKANVHIIAIPICNPSGFIDNTYYNRNNIAIGNTFTEGEHQNTQPESHLIRGVLDGHKDLDFYIDLHNMFARDGLIGFTMTNSEFFKRSAVNMYKSVGRSWQKRDNRFPQAFNHRWGYTTAANPTTITDFTSDVLGATSALVEFPRKSEFIPGSEDHDAQATQLGTEVLMNTIFSAIRFKR